MMIMAPKKIMAHNISAFFLMKKFWQIIEQLEEPEFLDGEFDKNEINEAMKKLLFDDSELNELIATVVSNRKNVVR